MAHDQCFNNNMCDSMLNFYFLVWLIFKLAYLLPCRTRPRASHQRLSSCSQTSQTKSPMSSRLIKN